MRTAHIFLQICLYDAAALCWVKSYVDSNTLQSVMQTVTQSQQGQDKKGSHGTWGKKKQEAGGRTGSETQREEKYRVKWRPMIKIVGTKDKWKEERGIVGQLV